MWSSLDKIEMELKYGKGLSGFYELWGGEFDQNGRTKTST